MNTETTRDGLPSYNSKTALQVLFNWVLIKLKAQHWEPSVLAGTEHDYLPVCAYRGPGGRRCAVGHCLPDRTYDPEMEDSTFLTLITRQSSFPGLPTYWVRPDAQELLRDLQKFHDNVLLFLKETEKPLDAAEYMDPLLNSIADKHTLTLPANLHPQPEDLLSARKSA